MRDVGYSTDQNVFKIVIETFQTVTACCKNTGLTISIYFFCVITAGAQTIPNQKISIDVKDVSLAEVLNEISLKAAFAFLIIQNEWRRSVRGKLSGYLIKSVSEILTDLAGRYEFQYSIVEARLLKRMANQKKTCPICHTKWPH
ncbi:MAG: hypothetical protein IPJ20_02765 [Flammeovirgaceae bacterium]|nr:hypothetical protein [Flammeovirgaceae bacterium]